MACESHHRLPSTNVPNFCSRVTGPGGERVWLLQLDRHGQDIAAVVGERLDRLASLNIPDDARGISRRCDDLPLVQEAAAGQVTVMSRKFLVRSRDCGLSQGMDRADIIQAAACHQAVVSRLEAAS